MAMNPIGMIVCYTINALFGHLQIGSLAEVVLLVTLVDA